MCRTLNSDSFTGGTDGNWNIRKKKRRQDVNTIFPALKAIPNYKSHIKRIPPPDQTLRLPNSPNNCTGSSHKHEGTTGPTKKKRKPKSTRARRKRGRKNKRGTPEPPSKPTAPGHAMKAWEPTRGPKKGNKAQGVVHQNTEKWKH